MMIGLTAFVLVLHGTLPATENTPRFASAYDIAGFVNYLAEHGHTLNVDARMSWAGVFAGAGMIQRVIGVNAIWFLRWTPVVLNLAYLFPVKALANVTLSNERARWVALVIFSGANWIDQDYFSPQGFNLLLFLSVIAVAVGIFGLTRQEFRWLARVGESDTFARERGRILMLLDLPSDAVPGERPLPFTALLPRVRLVTLTLLLLVASVISHQFTPLALVAALLALSLAGRTQLRWLWLICGVMVLAWLSWEAEPYWAGHLKQIFGSIGALGSTVSSSVGAHLHGLSSGQVIVERARVLSSLIIGAGAALGMWVLWRDRRTQWALGVLVVAPALVALGVNYGGEVALRVLLFSLAPASILIAGLINVSRPSLLRVLTLTALIGVLVAIFPLTRYGNESFEAIPAGDLAGARWLVTHAPTNTTVLLANSVTPIRFDNIAAYNYRYLGSALLDPVPKLTRELSRFRPGKYWIYLSRSQEQDAVITGGFRPNWMQAFERRLRATGKTKVLYKNQTSEILSVSKS